MRIKEKMMSRSDLVRIMGGKIVPHEETIVTERAIQAHTGLALAWLLHRPDDNGCRITQKVSVGGLVFRKHIKASLEIRTW